VDRKLKAKITETNNILSKLYSVLTPYQLLFIKELEVFLQSNPYYLSKYEYFNNGEISFTIKDKDNDWFIHMFFYIESVNGYKDYDLQKGIICRFWNPRHHSLENNVEKSLVELGQKIYRDNFEPDNNSLVRSYNITTL
jgi:hypothetical protein